MNAAQAMLIVGLRFYRWVLSPLKHAVLGPAARCRFTPSCSAYAVHAVTTHGAWRGSWLTVRRLSRCHPWGGSGYDPVPEPRAKAKPTAPREDTREHSVSREEMCPCPGLPFRLSGADRPPTKTQTSYSPAS